MLAGLSVKDSPPVVSSVGGYKEPPVDRFIAGYQAGAKFSKPDVKTLNGYSSDWDDQAKCKELALDQIARGSSVVFQVAGGCGLGALDAAGERDAWGIGVDADQSFLGNFVLTSAMKRVDEAVFRIIRSVTDGTWKGGLNVTFGLAEHGVGLGKLNADVPRSTARCSRTSSGRSSPARSRFREPLAAGDGAMTRISASATGVFGPRARASLPST